MSRTSFATLLATTGVMIVLQSVAHLLATGPFGEVDSVVDLDRSNGIPDVISTAAIAVASAGAIAVAFARRNGPWERVGAVLLAGCLGVITVDDVVGLDKDFTGYATLAVTGIAIVAAATVAGLDGSAGRRPALVLLSGLVALAATLAVGQLPELEQWFERARGDRIIEVQIVAKQGLELAGWCLVAIALWDIAVAARRSGTSVKRGR